MTTITAPTAMAIFAFLRSLLESIMKRSVYNHHYSAERTTVVAALRHSLIKSPFWPGPHDSHQAGSKSAEQHASPYGPSGTFDQLGQRSDLGEWHTPMLADRGSRVVRTIQDL